MIITVNTQCGTTCDTIVVTFSESGRINEFTIFKLTKQSFYTYFLSLPQQIELILVQCMVL